MTPYDPFIDDLAHMQDGGLASWNHSIADSFTLESQTL
jgi:hypothetical protein